MAFEKAKQGMSIGAIHLNLGKHGKRDMIPGLAKRQDLFVGTGVLAFELITGKSQNLKSFLAIFVVQRFQSCELRGKPALAGGIDDEEHLASIVGQGLVFSGNALTGHVVNRIHVADSRRGRRVIYQLQFWPVKTPLPIFVPEDRIPQ